MNKPPIRIKVGGWVRILATKQVGRVEAKQASCYRVVLPGGVRVLKNRSELARSRGPKPIAGK